MIVIDLKHPRHLFTRTRSTPGWDEPPSTLAIRPGAYLWDCVRRPIEALGQFAVRALSVLLHLSWQLTVTIELHAEVVTDDEMIALTTMEKFLRDPDTRVVVFRPQRGSTGWRAQGHAPIEYLSLYVVEPDHPEGPYAFSVRGVATARVTVPARDADLIYSYADIDPSSAPRPIRQLEAWDRWIGRTPVRRRSLR